MPVSKQERINSKIPLQRRKHLPQGCRSSKNFISICVLWRKALCGQSSHELRNELMGNSWVSDCQVERCLTLVWYILSMNVNTPTEAVRAWLEALPAEKKPIVEALRRLIEAAAPSAHEILYQETLRYRLTASGVGHLFYIAVFAAHVNLGFFFGGSLPDPERVLVGSGKRMRHLPIRSVQECENPAITSLLAQAWADGLQRVEHLPQQGT